MIQYDHLIGRQFKYGVTDCYAIVRDFYADNFGITLPDYARPNEFWANGLDLYYEKYHKNGFRPVDCHPSEYRIGDVVLMAINSPVACHAGVLVDKNRILHHMWGQLSTVTAYRGMFRNSMTAILRHKDVVVPEDLQVRNIVDTLPPHIRLKIDAALASHQ